MTTTDERPYSPGLAGVLAGETALSLVDGANALDLLFKILLPMLQPTILIVLLLRLAEALRYGGDLVLAADEARALRRKVVRHLQRAQPRELRRERPPDELEDLLATIEVTHSMRAVAPELEIPVEQVFRDLHDVFSGREPGSAPNLGQVAEIAKWAPWWADEQAAGLADPGPLPVVAALEADGSHRLRRTGWSLARAAGLILVAAGAAAAVGNLATELQLSGSRTCGTTLTSTSLSSR